MNEWEHRNDRNAGPGFGPGYTPGYPEGYPQDSLTGLPKKKKWIAGLLAFFVPGIGHFYLGQMAKGIAIMLLIAFDICAIVFAVTQIQESLVIVLLSLLLPIVYFYSLFDAVQSTDIVNHRQRYPNWQGHMYAPQRNFTPPQPPSAPSPMYGEESTQPNAAYTAAQADASGLLNDIPTGSSGPIPTQPQGTFPLGFPRQVNATGVMVLAVIVIVLVLIMGMGWTGWVFRSSGSMAGAFVLICAGIGLWVWELRGDRSRKR